MFGSSGIAAQDVWVPCCGDASVQLHGLAVLLQGMNQKQKNARNPKQRAQWKLVQWWHPKGSLGRRSRTQEPTPGPSFLSFLLSALVSRKAQFPGSGNLFTSRPVVINRGLAFFTRPLPASPTKETVQGILEFPWQNLFFQLRPCLLVEFVVNSSFKGGLSNQLLFLFLFFNKSHYTWKQLVLIYKHCNRPQALDIYFFNNIQIRTNLILKDS